MKYLPWITVMLLTLMLYMLSGTLTRSEGVLFDLPEAGLGEGETTELVALVMMHGHETLVFFDDARYSTDDGAQLSRLGEQLAERAGKSSRKTLLVMADKRVPIGEAMKLAAIARTSGVEKILFAQRRQEAAE